MSSSPPSPRSDVDERLMGEALALAERALAENEVPIGAVAALDGEVVASSYWRFRRDALLDHPECVVLRQAERAAAVQPRRGDVVLYTTLEPCLMCMGTAMSFRLGRVVYALEAPADGAGSVAEAWRPAAGQPPPSFPFYATPLVVGGVCRERSLRLVEAWVERNAAVPWAAALLPGFSHSTDKGLTAAADRLGSGRAGP
jgi:tRNA(adenine34) deaminase